MDLKILAAVGAFWVVIAVAIGYALQPTEGGEPTAWWPHDLQIYIPVSATYENAIPIEGPNGENWGIVENPIVEVWDRDSKGGYSFSEYQLEEWCAFEGHFATTVKLYRVWDNLQLVVHTFNPHEVRTFDVTVDPFFIIDLTIPWGDE